MNQLELSLLHKYQLWRSELQNINNGNDLNRFANSIMDTFHTSYRQYLVNEDFNICENIERIRRELQEQFQQILEEIVEIAQRQGLTDDNDDEMQLDFYTEEEDNDYDVGGSDNDEEDSDTDDYYDDDDMDVDDYGYGDNAIDDDQQQGLTAERIQKFQQFPADESLVGERCSVIC